MKARAVTTAALLLVAVHLSLVLANCSQGYKNSELEAACVDVDECVDYGPNICSNNSQCQNTNGSFHCLCNEGYAAGQKKTYDPSRGGECRDINECQVDDRCGQNASCLNTPGNYTCECNSGFQLRSGETKFIGNTETCKDIDECQVDDHCGQNASCHNTPGNYTCECNSGFQLRSGETKFIGNTETCKDIDECQVDDRCGQNASCLNTPGNYTCECNSGFQLRSGETKFIGNTETCKDIDECQVDDRCGQNASCLNTPGNYTCECNSGFQLRSGETKFTGNTETCKDIDECQVDDRCGQNASCLNTPGNYTCECNSGFQLRSGETKFIGNTETCKDICVIDQTICGNGACQRGADGHVCACDSGFTNYGNKRSRCVEIKCEVFRDLPESHPDVRRVLRLLESSCQTLRQSSTPIRLDGEGLLERLLTMIDTLLSGGMVLDNRHVSTLLGLVEGSLALIGPFLRPGSTRTSSAHAEVEMLLDNSPAFPRGPETLLSKHADVQIQWETAAGKDSAYPGFATMSLLTYLSMENFTNTSFSGMTPKKGQRLQMNSKVVTVKVSNQDTDALQEPVILTFRHLQEGNNTICVYWDSEVGSWKTDGCQTMSSDANYTVCSSKHLSSFAVLMALYDMEDPYEMQVFTWVGLTLSLACLLLCILTFALIRSIQGPRNSIHLHLCLSLFVANLVFLCGISRTENKTGCAVVAGLLHYFYLAAFCWMCLEGIQLFRMVVLVFNTSFQTARMMAVGYGVPAVIVAISALVNSKGYGSERHCWLNLEGSFIWSFFGPVCFVIAVNIFFFFITVWKLAQKFSSLNPDLNNLRKIKAFTITAVAQLCVLGTTWIFGCFQFEDGPRAISYLFTIFNSLQGVLLFVMHCLLSKPVREEYGKLFSSLTPQKKKYSEFTSSHSSKVQTSKSNQDTGESHI